MNISEFLYMIKIWQWSY